MSTTTVVGEPVLRDVKMHLLRPTEPGLGTIVKNERCTASKKAAGYVRDIQIDVSETPLVGECWPGQSIGVIPEGVDAAGKPHKVRLYSLSSPITGCDGQGKIYSVTVKRTIDEHWESHKLFLGVASNYLCDLRVGDSVTVTGPSGKRFIIPADPEAHDYVFVATGTGIAPFRGMILDLLESNTKSRIALVMGVPYANDLLYDEALNDLATRHPNFSYITALSRERQPDGAPPMYVQNRLETHRDLLGSMLSADRGLIYICGLAGMELGIFQQLARTLPPSQLDAYLEVDSDAMGSIEAWERRMIHKKVRPTRRIFTEVY